MKEVLMNFVKWEEKEAIPLEEYLEMNGEQLVDMYLASDCYKKTLSCFSESRADICKENKSWLNCPAWKEKKRCLKRCTLHKE